MPRLIVVDADLPKRLAVELTYRGRDSVPLSALHLHRSLDPIVLQRLRERFADRPFVFVTGDDQMLLEHAEHATGLTVAVVDPRRPDTFTLDNWRRECVHRWAHWIAEQEDGSHIRYGQRRSVWIRPRRRQPRTRGAQPVQAKPDARLRARKRPDVAPAAELDLEM